MDILQSKKEYLRRRLREKFFAGRKTRRVCIVGLGLQGGGVGAALFFMRLGFDVTITDKKTKKELAHSLRKLRGMPFRGIFGRHDVSDILAHELVVKNPAVPDSSSFISEIKRAGVRVTNDAELFLDTAPRERIIGVTGTKGKTTTAMLIGHLLGKKTCVVGIPGTSFFDYFSQTSEPRWIVAEFSSFDLEYVRVSPRRAVVTSLFADHLNRYPSFAAYARAKMNLVRFQKRGDTAFLAKIKTVSSSMPRTDARMVWVGVTPPRDRSRNVSWRLHQATVGLSRAVAHSCGTSPRVIEQRLATFEPPEGRLEAIGRIQDTVFINDTTATTPGAATASLHQLRLSPFDGDSITVITGGEDKRIPAADIDSYARALKQYHCRVVLLPGSFSKRLEPFLEMRVLRARTMPEAVKKARALQSKIVMLLPAAASFNLFRNEFDRAQQFKKALWQEIRKKTR